MHELIRQHTKGSLERICAGFYGEKLAPLNDVSIDEEQKLKFRALGYIE